MFGFTFGFVGCFGRCVGYILLFWVMGTGLALRLEWFAVLIDFVDVDLVLWWFSGLG